MRPNPAVWRVVGLRRGQFKAARRNDHVGHVVKYGVSKSEGDAGETFTIIGMAVFLAEETSWGRKLDSSCESGGG